MNEQQTKQLEEIIQLVLRRGVHPSKINDYLTSELILPESCVGLIPIEVVEEGNGDVLIDYLTMLLEGDCS